jgi:mannose-1-phosphate guanylyltransferase
VSILKEVKINNNFYTYGNIMNLIPVIISGGSGSRLWPVSRESYPKPFMKFPDGDSLLSKTFQRACALNNILEILTITHHDLFFKTENEYEKTASSVSLRYILEPFGRNTAAAVAAAALYAQCTYGDDVHLLILSADHLIKDEQAFQLAVSAAGELAGQGWHVTFGVQPEYLETGFGYIEIDNRTPLNHGHKVLRFIEKPEVEKAVEYINSETHFWNSGVFYFKTSALLEELKLHAPEILAHTKRAFDSGHNHAKAQGDNKVIRLADEHFVSVPDISLDYALMEKSEKIAMIACAMGWSDLGSWHTMGSLVTPDENQNRLDGEVITHGAHSNYVYSPDRLVALLGVENLVVVDTDDALLISHKDRVQEVKNIVTQLKQKKHKTYKHHKCIHRPWGTFTLIEEGERFKIKRIEVKPGASLSLQMHHHRNEHWIIVAGIAKVINDTKSFYLKTNESTYIPAGQKHRVENPGLIDLIMIEVQSGSYLGEDDIIRFEDKYGRA